MRWMLLLALLVAGCGAAYEARLNQWMGKSEADLVASWGPPDSVRVDGPDKYLTYYKNRPIFIPGTAPTYIGTVTSPGTVVVTGIGGSDPTYIDRQCRTTFGLHKGKVLAWDYKGC